MGGSIPVMKLAPKADLMSTFDSRVR
jgi:hypothetical protein